MRCETVKDLVDMLRDDTLGGREARQVREHLAGCRSCATEWDATEKLKEAIRDRASCPAAPPAFRVALTRRLLERQPARVGWAARLQEAFGRRPITAIWLAVAVVLVVLLPLMPRILSMREPAVAPLVEESINEHIRLTLRKAPPEIPGYELQPLPDKERELLAFPETLSFPDDQEFRLVGGQVSTLLNRRVLAVRYRKADRPITVLVLPDSGLWLPAQSQIPVSHIHRATHRGFQAIQWQKGSLVYSVVSDADEANLSRLAEKLRQN